MTVLLGPYLLSALWNSGVSAFQGLLMYINISKIRLGLYAASELQWMSVFQGCPQGRVALYAQVAYQKDTTMHVWSYMYNSPIISRIQL